MLDIDRTDSRKKTALHFGDVTVNALPTIFKKIKMTTFENIGSGPIHLPEEELHTSVAWLELKETDSEIGEKNA
ncbi:hypothetical protein ACNSPU_10915 [Bacillus velezensis]